MENTEELLKEEDIVYVARGGTYSYWVCYVKKVEYHQNFAKTITYHLVEVDENTKYGLIQEVEIDSKYINGKFDPFLNRSIYTKKEFLIKHMETCIDEHMKYVNDINNKMKILCQN